MMEVSIPPRLRGPSPSPSRSGISLSKQAVAADMLQRVIELLRACSPKSGIPEEDLPQLWWDISDEDLARGVEDLMHDIDTLATEVGHVFWACEAESPMDGRIPVPQLYDVTQRLIFCFGCAHHEALDRIAAVFEAATAGREEEGVGDVAFQGHIAAVLNQVLRELLARAGLRSKSHREGRRRDPSPHSSNGRGRLSRQGSIFSEEDYVNFERKSLARRESSRSLSPQPVISEEVALAQVPPVSQVPDLTPGLEPAAEAGQPYGQPYSVGPEEDPFFSQEEPMTAAPSEAPSERKTWAGWLQQSFLNRVDDLADHFDKSFAPPQEDGVQPAPDPEGREAAAQPATAAAATAPAAAQQAPEQAPAAAEQPGYGGFFGDALEPFRPAPEQDDEESHGAAGQLLEDRVPEEEYARDMGAPWRQQMQSDQCVAPPPQPVRGPWNGDLAAAHAHSERQMAIAQAMAQGQGGFYQSVDQGGGLRGFTDEEADNLLEQEGLPVYVAFGQHWESRLLLMPDNRNLYVVDEHDINDPGSIIDDSPCFALIELQQITRKEGPGLHLLRLEFDEGCLLLRFSYPKLLLSLVKALIAERRVPVVEARA